MLDRAFAGHFIDKCHDHYNELVNKKRILHSWSFHMKFIKRAFGEFDKFHMK